MFQMMTAEYLHARNTGQQSKVLLGFNIPAWVWTSYCKVRAYFLLFYNFKQYYNFMFLEKINFNFLLHFKISLN